MHFRVQGTRYKIGGVFGLVKFQIFLECLTFLIFFGGGR